MGGQVVKINKTMNKAASAVVVTFCLPIFVRLDLPRDRIFLAEGQKEQTCRQPGVQLL